MLYHRDTLKAAACGASTDETRPALCGVRLEGNGRAVSTDGCVLIVVESPAMPAEEFPAVPGSPFTFQSEPVTVPVKPLLEAAKATPRNGTLPVLHHVAVGAVEGRPDAVRLVATDLDRFADSTVKALDRFYPDYQKVIPTGDPVVTIGFRVDVFEKVLKALKLGGATTFSLAIRTPLGAAVFESVGCLDRKLSGLVMPCRLDK